MRVKRRSWVFHFDDCEKWIASLTGGKSDQRLEGCYGPGF